MDEYSLVDQKIGAARGRLKEIVKKVFNTDVLVFDEVKFLGKDIFIKTCNLSFDSRVLSRMPSEYFEQFVKDHFSETLLGYLKEGGFDKTHEIRIGFGSQIKELILNKFVITLDIYIFGKSY